MDDTAKNAALADQKPLPGPASTLADNHPSNSDSASDHSPSRRWKRNAASKTHDESEDMNVDDSDADADHADHNDEALAGSDGESANADEPKTSKKKRTQRFYCTDYPPCNLSFTRSEHLARHIRKHTGERPFQCHCSRRFSRLDNLRQHAQTVHVNEDIPMDSLAASGTRFQRQIRAERVRPTGARMRTALSTSLVAPMRGHSKALSTSSLASNSSVGSTIYAMRDDMRRRPPPLVMADQRPRTPIDASYRMGPTAQDLSYGQHSPTEYTTPTSASYSTGPLSPRWGDRVLSPSSARSSRPHSMYATLRNGDRRLSLSSAAGNPFQSPPALPAGRGPFSSHGGLFSSSAPGNESGPPLASPTSTANWSRRNSNSSASDGDWRRRTWHPDSRELAAASNSVFSSPPPAPSRLSYSITSSQYASVPVASAPLADPAAQRTNLRLPGIESFDPRPRHRPSTPPAQLSAPMAIDSDSPMRSTAFEPSPDGHRVSIHQRDLSLHRGLTRLEIAPGASPRNGASVWADEANRGVQAQAGQFSLSDARQASVRFEGEGRVQQLPFGSPEAPVYAHGHHHTASAPSFSSGMSRQQRRQAWYNGPRDQHAESLVHPNLANGFSGFPARVPQTVHEHQSPPAPEPQESQYPDRGHDHRDGSPGISRLDALVAAATQASTAAY